MTDLGRLVADHVLLRAKAGEIQQQLAALNEASPSAIIFAHGDGTADSWNAATSTLLGWPPAATHTETLIGEKEAPAPPDRGEHVQYLGGSGLNAGDTYHDVETTQLTRAGSVIDVSISGAPGRLRLEVDRRTKAAPEARAPV